MDDVGDEIEIAAVARLSRDGGREICGAVIGVFARDDVLLLRPAMEVVVELDEAQRRIDGRRSAGGEEDMVQIARRVFGEPAAEIDRGRRRNQPEGREIGHAPHLVGDGLGHLLAAIADIDAPHAADAVDHAVAAAVVDMDALGLGDDQGLARLGGAQIDPGMDDVVAILLPERFGVIGEIAAHEIAPGSVNGGRSGGTGEASRAPSAPASAAAHCQMLLDERQAGLDRLVAREAARIEQGLQPEAVDHGHERPRDIGLRDDCPRSGQQFRNLLPRSPWCSGARRAWPRRGSGREARHPTRR